MILKLGMKHQAMELYKVYINHDPVMTLTDFYCKVKIGQIFMNLKMKLNPGVVLTMSWGYIHVYDLYSQTSLLVYISNLR